MNRLRLIIILSIILLIGFGFFLYWNAEIYDKKCLDEIGKEFCENKNLSYPRFYTTNMFRCRDKSGQDFISFIDKEMVKECIDKHSKTITILSNVVLGKIFIWVLPIVIFGVLYLVYYELIKQK